MVHAHYPLKKLGNGIISFPGTSEAAVAAAIIASD